MTFLFVTFSNHFTVNNCNFNSFCVLANSASLDFALLKFGGPDYRSKILNETSAADKFGMKNRKLPTQKKEENKKTEAEKSKSSVELRSKKKPAANSFFQKSQQILQSYNSLFKKTSYHLGDADTFFRHSLRNYDDFDLFKGVKWDGLRKVQSVRSFEFIKEKKKTALRAGDGDKNNQKLEVKKPSVKVELKEVEVEEEKSESEEEFVVEEEQVAEEAAAEEDSDLDDDKDKFYSPSSQQIEELEEIKEEDELEVKFEIKPEVTKSVQFEIKLEVQTEENLEKVEPEVTLQVQSEVKVEVQPQTKQSKSLKMEEAGDEDTVADTETEIPDDSAATEAPTEYNMSDVENVLEQANTELTEIMEQNPDLAETLDAPGDSTADGEAFKYDPQSDNMLMKELEDAERQAKETAQIIYELKLRLAQLCSVEKMTDAERDELEEKNLLLKKCMDLFEEKTKRIQFLVGQANLFENMISPRPPLQQKHKEDLLPKVIICGMTQCGNIPKIIVCEDHKKKKKTSVVPQFAKRLSESYNMQEKLAAENADLEGRRYQLQEDLLNKDQTVESLQRKLHSLQAEMRMVCKENTLLSEKLEKIQSCPGSVPPCQQGDTIENQKIAEKAETKKMKCGRGRPCPADVEARLQEYSQTTQQLESQLGEMESEVRNMQTELIAVQKERQHLEHHRRMLCTPPPCIPTCPRPPPCPPPPCPGPCNPNRPTGSDQQLRELREQYNRLQDDYKGKLTEVAGLRADNEKLKQTAKDAEELKKMAEDKMKECERELKQFKLEAGKMAGSKEQLIEQEQQLNVAKQRFREAQDELEELRALIQDQQAQLEDYRNKYLQAQQQVEEQRRQIDMMEMENNRVSEQVNLEIQRVKNQFQEKLQELTPLPDILKATQLKLQEAQQMHLLAERNNEQLSRELQAYRDRAAEMANQMEKVKSDQQLGADEKATLQAKIDEWERKCHELQEDNDGLRTELARMEEVAEQNEKRVQEKLHEIAQLVAQLETVREESARQVARTKDRCETVRRSMQNQIADLERQLAQSRAQARAAQKDRDEIRQKMQSQINNLNENFEDAQMRIRNLQGHVNFLKNSYTNVFPPDPNLAMISDGMDACDCGNTY